MQQGTRSTGPFRSACTGEALTYGGRQLLHRFRVVGPVHRLQAFGAHRVASNPRSGFSPCGWGIWPFRGPLSAELPRSFRGASAGLLRGFRARGLPA